jgi:hypothetical protein
MSRHYDRAWFGHLPKPRQTKGRHRERVFPVLGHNKVSRRKTMRLFVPARVKRVSDMITRTSKIAEAYRWIPMRQLDSYVMLVEDARYWYRR